MAGPIPTRLSSLGEVFVSYSRRDTAWRERLFGEAIDTPLGSIPIWSDAKIRVGDEWTEEIQSHLDAARVAVLLVSRSFLESRFIRLQELPRILARYHNDDLKIVWIPIGSVEPLKESPTFAELRAIQAAPLLLPETPHDHDELISSLSRQVHLALSAAIDPLGAELTNVIGSRYRIDRRIGEGNVAVVYKAKDALLDRDVAIKIVKDHRKRSDFMNDVRESLRTSELANFISVYDVADARRVAYCVVQHIEGRSLRSRINEYPQGLPVSLLSRIFNTVAAAIARAHAMGVTYGNLRPSNILLDASDEPFILPVGRSHDRKRHHKRLQDLIDRTRKGVASPADEEEIAYLAPDSFGARTAMVDPKSVDQYTLGLLAYEMATGQSPRRIDDPRALLELGKAAFRPLPRISEQLHLCPQKLDDMIAKMTAMRTADRFSSLQEVLEITRRFHDLDVTIARDSYRRCAAVPGFDEKFFTRFYGELLRRCPSAAPFFDHFGPEQWQRQYRFLKEAILLLFAFRETGDTDVEPHLLSRVADTHRNVDDVFPMQEIANCFGAVDEILGQNCRSVGARR